MYQLFNFLLIVLLFLILCEKISRIIHSVREKLKDLEKGLSKLKDEHALLKDEHAQLKDEHAQLNEDSQKSDALFKKVVRNLLYTRDIAENSFLNADELRVYLESTISDDDVLIGSKVIPREFAEQFRSLRNTSTSIHKQELRARKWK